MPGRNIQQRTLVPFFRIAGSISTKKNFKQGILLVLQMVVSYKELNSIPNFKKYTLPF